MDAFVERLRKSGLMEHSILDAAVNEVRAVPGDAIALARHLIRQGHLTKWQGRQLLDGRYKGFFLGKYKLLDQLGRGGMSMVYVAEHTAMRRKVAVKVLPKSRLHDRSFLERFCREAQASAALSHPNIVRAYDFDCQDDTYFLVMELVEGRNLRDVVTQDGPLAFDHLVNYFVQAARGLQHAHDAGLIHRDIKPANILVDHDHQVKLLDLGLALIAGNQESSVTLANDEQILGTADYLAPEQALNSHLIDARADIYGLGATMYFALTGRAPYPEGSIAQKLAQHQNAPIPDPRHVRSDCPEFFASLCMSMLTKTPDDRVQTAAEVVSRLLGHDLPKNNGPRFMPKGALPTAYGRSPSDIDKRSSDDPGIENAFRLILETGDQPMASTSHEIVIHAVDVPDKSIKARKPRRREFPWWLWIGLVVLGAAAIGLLFFVHTLELDFKL